MSTADKPTPARDDARQVPRTTTKAARKHGGGRSGGLLALAVLLALLAVLGAGYVGWRQWLLTQHNVAGSAELASLQQRVGALETSLHAVDTERANLKQQLDHVSQQDQGLSAQIPGLDERTRRLEDAVAALAERTRSGREPMLLDETESLLRMAVERYRLFHDGEGAERAYALADQTLATVADGAFNSVRQAISAERDALAKNQPDSRAHALQQLQSLRARVPSLPLRPLDQPRTSGSDGVWRRIGHAVASVIRVNRDNGGPLALQDARFARELTLLDLAQAQVALLAYDGKAYAAAVHRADASLSSQFDHAAPAVQQAREELQQLETVAPHGRAVELGAALTELRNLRAVHALRPAPASSSTSQAAPAGTKSTRSGHAMARGGSRS